MSLASAVVVAVIGFVAGLGGVAAAQLWQAGRARRDPRLRQDGGPRPDRLRPSLEPLLHAAIRLERYLATWSPTWPLALSEERRSRASALFDELDESAEIAETMLRLDGTAEAVQRLRDLRARIARFQVALAAVPASTADAPPEVGAAAAAVTSTLPELKTVLLAHLDVPQLRAPETAAVAARPAAVAWPASLAPLRHSVFRWLWLAALASQLGTWTQNVGAVDLMAAPAPTALLLALIQTATSLPGLLLALPAGALADLVDRRRLLVTASAWMCAVSALLAVTTMVHLTAWWWLLGLTFALGVGTVAGLPAWQAIIPDLVPRDGLAPAVTLSSLAINLARVAGPALGGLAVALAGPGAAFGLTTAAFGFTAVVVACWRRDVEGDALAPEGIPTAIRSGVRYSLGTARVRAILVRAAGFIGASSALWALLPLVSRRLGQGSAGYGLLLGALGVGAVVGVLLLAAARRALRPGALVVAASLGLAIVVVGLALVPTYWAALLLMPFAGGAWVSALSTFNVAAQQAAPRWVRGRVLASYQVAYMGSLAIGSALWGTVASRLGTVPALEIAAALLAVSVLLALPWRLHVAETADGDPIEAPAATVEPPLPLARLAQAPEPAPPARVPPARVPVRQAAAASEPAAANGDGRGHLAGGRLGAYRLEALAAAGPAGSVYLASSAGAGAPCAVEVVTLEAGQVDGYLAGARMASTLHHPNIVPVTDCGAEDGMAFLVREHAESLTLAEHLARLQAPAGIADPAVRRCVREIALALDYAHACGVAHGDLRPANVLIRARDGRAMVTGFAALPARTGVEVAAAAPAVAAYAAVAPEQWVAGTPPTVAGDVYAFAALLFEVATGGPPYGRVLARMAGHPDRPLPPLGLAAPHLPPALDAVLTRGLATSPKVRPRTAGDLAAAYLDATDPVLPALMERAPLPVPAARPAVLVARRGPAARGRQLWPGAVAVLGSAALLGITLATRAQGAPGGGLPAPVAGSIGVAMEVASTEVTVQSVSPDAAPPLRLAQSQRMVAVAVRYQAGADGPALVSPYDWTITDGAGQVYVPMPDAGPAGLHERPLAAGQTTAGLVGFAVPRTASGLVLHYEDELTDESAQIPLP